MARAFKFFQRIDSKARANDHTIGIDLGSYQTSISVEPAEHPTVVPSYLVFLKETKEIISIGNEAKEIVGRNSREIELLSPVRYGIPTDPQMTSEFLNYCLKKTGNKDKRFSAFVGSTVFFLVSPNISEVQYRTFEQTTQWIRINLVSYLVRPMIAHLALHTSQQLSSIDVIVDCGYESTSFSLLQFGKVSYFQKMMYGGKTLNNEIQSFLRHSHQIDVGLASCEKLKQECAKIVKLKTHQLSVNPNNRAKTQTVISQDFFIVVRGRDILSSHPKTIKVAAEELRPLLEEFVNQVVEDISRIIEGLGPQLVDDVVRRGIHLIGGMSVFTLLIQKIEEQFGTLVHTVDLPDEVYHRGFLKFFQLSEREKKLYYFQPQWI